MLDNYFVVRIVDRDTMGAAIASDDCTKIAQVDNYTNSRYGPRVGPSFDCLSEAIAYADGCALQNLLGGSFVRSTAYFVYSKARLQEGGFLADYWTHGIRIASRVGERVAELLRG